MTGTRRRTAPGGPVAVAGACALAIGAATVGFAAGSAPAISPAREFVDRVLGYIGLRAEACPAEVVDEWPDRATLCAAYGSHFSAFKLDVETTLRRHNIASAVTPIEPWTYRAGRYQRVVEVEGERIVVVFDERTRRVMLALPGEGGEVVEEVITGRPSGPRIAGFGGVSTPRILLEGRVPPRYPAEAEERGIRGSVSLKVLVLRDGSVGRVDVLRVDPAGWKFDDAAVEAVLEWTFEPARYRDEPVDVVHTISVAFEPEAPAEEAPVDSGPERDGFLLPDR